MTSRILLVDDHKIVRDGIKSLLSEEADMEVVGEADNGREAVLLARRLRPDLVVMDVSMPELNGIEATRQILSEMDGVKVLALSMHREPRFVAGILEAGAKGYLVKDCTANELTSVIRLVAQGKTFLSPEVTDMVVKGFVGRLGEDVSHPPASVLSPREREVLQLLAEGRKVKDVAEELHLGVKTVETHRRNLMEKLGIDNLVDLIRYALREGVTSLDDWLAY
ncbi:response regulator transcription factor [Desulfoferula mesophila]|uniref:DNA-binding response regulator n=1 Tax=Desulfoferula mesophila TaxID=3058419 RepID=A0AAU9E8W3_9BACT|nr:DNA-binding response regulator [Desulfoferula mesophilus]